MTMEEQLKQKSYYKMFINEHEEIHPIRILGDAFQEEARKDIPELSSIRFAQGEVYFHHKDFEAAIFKWENIDGELKPWARKNTADAYFELGMLSTAEDIYTTIETDNLTLTTEIALKLFSLYIVKDKFDSAVSVIKKTIAANPDYPSVTAIARTFFEKQKDWNNAIELAVNEAIRTESLEWFDILQTYVEKGVTKSHAPSYFTQAFVQLYQVDKKKFEQLISAFWNSYKHEESYFTWIKEINQLLLNLDLERSFDWTEVSRLHKDTYFSFINGKYFIQMLQEFIPDLLTNWLRIADSKNIVVASAAVLSWNELFPAAISQTIVKEAENLLSVTETDMDELEECLTLFDSIIKWAENHEMGENNRVQWIVEQLIDFETRHVLVTGLSGSGKSTFLNTILGEYLQDGPTTSVVLFKDAEELEITEITDREITRLSGFAGFQERMDRLRRALDSIIEFGMPNSFLKENQVAFIDTPGLKGSRNERYEVLKNLQVADTILFVLDANAPFTEKEQEAIAEIGELAPDIPIHFLINKMDTVVNEQEVIQETKSLIRAALPDAKIFAFSSRYDRNQQLSGLKAFIDSIKNTRNIADKRLAKLLYFIRITIAGMLQKRIDLENQLAETIRWNEEMLAKLTGAIHQLRDTVSQKTEVVANSYRSIKETIEKEIATQVPKILKECSALVKEDSNFSKIHIELNEEMNKRLQDYLEYQVMPVYCRSLGEWIDSCKEEFVEAQEYLNDRAEGFNSLYGEERLVLECDFKVLDDWRRDTDRLTSRFHLDFVNIMLRRTPSQFLLKSAGKLFGALSQNKAMLYNKYKAFVENEDYAEIAKEVSRQFFRPFALLEDSLERDVSMFFKQPMNILNNAAEEAQKEISANQEMLTKLNTNPEIFRDPLTLFNVRLRQFEWMTVAGKGMQPVY
ncbi:dynamin family protein [Neobacillus fumarioli]|uniref:dynamin family protein n=1 Tax=Neobacillus fumarioli TaxID=105229 RepID=UPI00082E422A|nr:dynamin family protein [Neobacillus fumarioli]